MGRDATDEVLGGRTLMPSNPDTDNHTDISADLRSRATVALLSPNTGLSRAIWSGHRIARHHSATRRPKTPVSAIKRKRSTTSRC